MCMFSGPVREVSETRIFARAGDGSTQFLVYEMTVRAKQQVAMVLPTPVNREKGENALKFINLEKYSDFFSYLNWGFPSDLPRDSVGKMSMGGGMPGKTLPVQNVGAFEASFVPSLADFGRLDPQFRMSEKVWDAIPSYKDWGFAVFKLKDGEHRYHPMAFSFERSSSVSQKLFFPTVHVHDTRIYKTADFDHVLYCQSPPTNGWNVQGWTESSAPMSKFVNLE